MEGLTQESSFFAEHNEYMSALASLLRVRSDAEAAPLVDRLTTIMNNYQEQPNLLDPVLPSTIGPAMQIVRTSLREWYLKAQNEHTSLKRSLGAAPDAAVELPFQTYHNPYLHKIFQLIYGACKTRGYKTIIKHFPHEVADLEPALYCLLCQDTSRHDIWESRYVLLLWLSILVLVPFDLRTVDSNVDASGRKNIVFRITQACKSFLADAGAVREASAVCLARLLTRPDLDMEHLRSFCDWGTRALSLCSLPSEQIINPANVTISSTAAESAGVVLGKGGGVENTSYISASGSATSVGVVANNVVVSASVAAFLSRLETELDIPATSLSAASRVFLSTGVMRAFVEVAKHGHRDTLKSILGDLFSRVIAITSDESKTATGATTLKSSPLLRKLMVKLGTRTGLAYMPPRVVSWRYQRGQRSLLDNLSQAGVTAAKQKMQETTNIASDVCGAGLPDKEEEEEDDSADVPSEMEEIIDILLTGLRDTDTAVRWSAAKGVGRVTGRLPKLFADDVVGAVLELLHTSESDGSWHGGCLALAELARRGLLLPARLAEVVPRVLQALVYDVRRGSHSVGQHVRDAACYVCWAFARAYAPAVMKPYVLPLAQGMLTVALFDREVNCRRAASAAFQENVGRQGHENFPNGIEILTCADYFTLGNRANAYCKVAPYVARFEQYRLALLEHLLNVKIVHWDKEVRALAAKALAEFVHLDAGWFVEKALATLLPLTTSSELFVRHGSILGIAEIVLALARANVTLPTEVLDNVRNIVVKAEKARAYTGRGGEMVRAAMCRLIECQCLAGHPLSKKAALRLLQTVDECLKHPNDFIQATALKALKALAQYCFNDSEEASVDRLPKTYVTKLNTDDNPAVRRGLALALGALPKTLYLGSVGGHAVLPEVLEALIKATKQERQVAKRDAETRRNAVMGLTSLVQTIGLGKRSKYTWNTVDNTISASSAPAVTLPACFRAEDADGLTAEQFTTVINALLCATHDYASDNRGDVGSWVRKAALDGLLIVTEMALEQSAVCQRIHYLTGKRADNPWSAFTTPSAMRAEELWYLRLPKVASHFLRRLRSGAASHSHASYRALTAGFSASISGYGAGQTLVDFHEHEMPHPYCTHNHFVVGMNVQTTKGVSGVLQCISGGGRLCSVVLGSGETHVCGADELQYAMLTPPPAIELIEADESVAEQLPILEIFGAFARILGEKLDLLRGVAGEGLCKLVHLPFPLQQLHTLPGYPVLQKAFHVPVLESIVRVGLPSLVVSLSENFGAVWIHGNLLAEEVEEESPDASVYEDSTAEASTPHGEHTAVDVSAQLRHDIKAGAPLSAQLTESELVQWALPHHAFPRLVKLLSIHELVPYVTEGLVASFGGLSESVVKHSSAAFVAWIQESKRAGHFTELTSVGQSILALLRPRAVQPWDLFVDSTTNSSAAALAMGGYTGGFDPSMSRWFREILGTSSATADSDTSAPAKPQTTKIEVRLTTSALRTMEIMLSNGGLDHLQPPESTFAEEVVTACRKRAQNAREDATKIMAAASVALGVLHFAPPASVSALILLCDLLGHPFPKVRKVVAEQFYIRLLTIGDTALHGRAGDVDAVLTVLTETPWDSELSDVLGPRDRLYAFLGLEMPAVRGGTDASMFSMQKAAKAADTAQEDDSYGNLVREMGY